jgi:hypothetical protein
VSLDALPPQGTRDVYARRSSLGHQGWDEHQLAVPKDLPLPGNTGRGLPAPARDSKGLMPLVNCSEPPSGCSGQFMFRSPWRMDEEEVAT